MDDSECASSKYDIEKNTNSVRQKTKIELLQDLQKKRIDTTSKRFLKTELIAMCNSHSIPTEITVVDIRPGWSNRPKGILQILYERGFIDKNLVVKPTRMRYTREGRKSDLDKETQDLKDECKKFSLTHVLSNCTDFKNKKQTLNSYARRFP